jgi:putative effector of murein hydrolase LrgA (UPF0299 family)
MIPAAISTIAPAQTVGELFGPLAPIAVLGVIGGLVILVALLVAEARSTARRSVERGARETRALGETKTASPVRPAA